MGAPPSQKSTKQRPAKLKAHVRAASLSLLPDDPDDELRTLLDELNPDDRRVPRWKIHDRTHLELSLDRLIDRNAPTTTQWEAYYFFPHSFQLDPVSYPRDRFYRDLQSYVRFGVRRRTLAELAAEGFRDLKAAAGRSEADTIFELRMFSCRFRASLFLGRRGLRDLLTADAAQGDATRDDAAIDTAAGAFAAAAVDLLKSFRETLKELPALVPSALKKDGQVSESLEEAMQLTDEAVSRVAETVTASLSLQLRQEKHKTAAAFLARVAVNEARYRRDAAYDSVATKRSGRRDIEHLEFRRHVLKRFSEAILWITPVPRKAGRMVLQVLYAVAAGVAMAFGVTMAAYYGSQDAHVFSDLWKWALIVILAYAGRDRIKYGLKDVFEKWWAKHYPERRFELVPRGRKTVVGIVEENLRYPKESEIKEEVMLARNSSRHRPLEQDARQEQIIWHQRKAILDLQNARKVDKRYSAITEIVRLDLARVVRHTDDPKQKIVFADPDDEHVYSALAPRVYNISIVYRLDDGSGKMPWRRVRVVVSRKGIERLEKVSIKPRRARTSQPGRASKPGRKRRKASAAVEAHAHTEAKPIAEVEAAEVEAAEVEAAEVEAAEVEAAEVEAAEVEAAIRVSEPPAELAPARAAARASRP